MVAQPSAMGHRAAMRLLSALLLLACVLGCSDDHDDDHGHTARPAVCQEIGTRCHDFEDVSAVGKECHEASHATWTEAQCTAKKAECFAVCTPADTGVADTATDAPADGG
jgi:hypothetical protein